MTKYLERFNALMAHLITYSSQVLCIISEKSGPSSPLLASQP